MSLLSNIKLAVQASIKGSVKSSKMEFGQVDYTIPQIPLFIEKKNDAWIWYGENNLYPQQVSDLRNGSPIHNSIIKIKTKMTAGEGFLINDAINEADNKEKLLSLPSAVKVDYDLFTANKNGTENLYSITKKLAEDLQTHGQFCYEIIYNSNFTKIVQIKYVDVENVRAGKLVKDKPESYWYSKDWSKTRVSEFKPTEFKPFDITDKTNLNQLVFEKVGKNDFYGDIPYRGALLWVQVDVKMGIFHLTNMDNGMNPSLWWKFFKLPADANDKANILSSLDSTYKGANNTGKRIVTFSDGKELSPEIAPIQTSNLDKQLILVAELCDQKILTGHQLSAPLLAGITTKVAMGGNAELEKQYNIFDNTIIAPDRKLIYSSLQKILDFNKTAVTIEINPFDPFKEKATKENNILNALSVLNPALVSKVLEKMTDDEIRNLVGLNPALIKPIV